MKIGLVNRKLGTRKGEIRKKNQIWKGIFSKKHYPFLKKKKTKTNWFYANGFGYFVPSSWHVNYFELKLSF